MSSGVRVMSPPPALLISLAYGFGAGSISWRDPGSAKMFAAVVTAETMSADVEEIESKISDPCSPASIIELAAGECQPGSGKITWKIIQIPLTDSLAYRSNPLSRSNGEAKTFRDSKYFRRTTFRV